MTPTSGPSTPSRAGAPSHVIQGFFPGGRPKILQASPAPAATFRPSLLATVPVQARPAFPPVPTLASRSPTGGLQPAARAGQPARPSLPAPTRPGAVQPAAPLRPQVPQPILPQTSRPGAVQPQAGNAFALPANFTLKPRGSGQALPGPIQKKMESFFNTSFADVRVHVGREAPSIGALAFTHGTDLYFAPGQYNPQTLPGQKLLGHELAHVVQQRAGRVCNALGAGLAVVQDPALEAEAEAMGTRAASASVPIQAELAATELAFPPSGAMSPKSTIGANAANPPVVPATNTMVQRRPVATVSTAPAVRAMTTVASPFSFPRPGHPPGPDAVASGAGTAGPAPRHPSRSAIPSSAAIQLVPQYIDVLVQPGIFDQIRDLIVQLGRPYRIRDVTEYAETLIGKYASVQDTRSLLVRLCRNVPTAPQFREAIDLAGPLFDNGWGYMAIRSAVDRFLANPDNLTGAEWAVIAGRLAVDDYVALADFARIAGWNFLAKDALAAAFHAAALHHNLTAQQWATLAANLAANQHADVVHFASIAGWLPAAKYALAAAFQAAPAHHNLTAQQWVTLTGQVAANQHADVVHFASIAGWSFAAKNALAAVFHGAAPTHHNLTAQQWAMLAASLGANQHADVGPFAAIAGWLPAAKNALAAAFQAAAAHHNLTAQQWATLAANLGANQHADVGPFASIAGWLPAAKNALAAAFQAEAPTHHNLTAQQWATLAANLGANQHADVDPFASIAGWLPAAKNALAAAYRAAALHHNLTAQQWATLAGHVAANQHADVVSFASLAGWDFANKDGLAAAYQAAAPLHHNLTAQQWATVAGLFVINQLADVLIYIPVAGNYATLPTVAALSIPILPTGMIPNIPPDVFGRLSLLQLRALTDGQLSMITSVQINYVGQTMKTNWLTLQKKLELNANTYIEVMSSGTDKNKERARETARYIRHYADNAVFGPSFENHYFGNRHNEVENPSVPCGYWTCDVWRNNQPDRGGVRLVFRQDRSRFWYTNRHYDRCEVLSI